jgi:hypothetical protein
VICKTVQAEQGWSRADEAQGQRDWEVCIRDFEISLVLLECWNGQEDWLRPFTPNFQVGERGKIGAPGTPRRPILLSPMAILNTVLSYETSKWIGKSIH